MNKQTQKQTILNHLKKRKPLTSWQAITAYKITRLAVYISELIKEGYNISKKKKGDGYTEYRLVR